MPKKKKILLLVALVFIQIAAFVLVNPKGNFAANDDWFYARAVKEFHFNGYRLDPLITPSLMGQIWYSRAVTGVFGFSLETLRYTTLGLSVLMIVALFFLLLELGFREKFAFFASLICLFNPLFFYLSTTFMTDVPALAFVVFALWALAKFQNTDQSRYFFLAHIFLIYAVTIRQNYVFLLPLSFIFLIGKKQTFKKNLFLYCLGLILLGALYFWLRARQWWPLQDLDLHAFSSRQAHWQHVKDQIYFIWHYLGFFLLPLTLGFLFGGWGKRKILSYSLIFVSLVCGIVMAFAKGRLFPYYRNILSVYGLGPRGTDLVLTGTPLPIIGTMPQIILTLLVSLSAGILLALIVTSAIRYFSRSRQDRQMIGFLILAALSQVATVFMFLSFDRYYLPIFLFLLIGLGFFINKLKISALNIFVLSLLALLVVSLTSLNLSENRVKWQIADKLKADGVPVTDIDGGYEWLGWNWYGRTPAWQVHYFYPGIPWYIGQIFADNLRVYVVSYSPTITGYQLIKTYPYGEIFGRRYNLYLYKK